ncbi:hypothetical protein ACM44_14760 [Chryseobacterium koreense CCUG 49689]|uniref:Uncharacterized protein n=2 Tax=Chryseobacterium koreense TaxID=232216 RepID=A0A0J7IPB8_9FLAO|nr:hypothetical protein ACM44_14760 [Chryseobacterium koreense CCUG 49689]
MRILTIVFLFQFLNLFSQDKTVQNFENAINEGYINSPTLIPIYVIENNKEKKYFLSDTETLYSAFEKELNQTNSDSLKKYILKNKSNQTFEFKNINALEIIGINRRKNINPKEIRKINKYIERKKILNGLQELQNKKKQNSRSYDQYYKQRMIIRDRILNEKEFNNDEKKLLGYLATNITTDENTISDLGNWASFENSNKIFELWNKEISIYKNKYAESEKIENELNEKFVIQPEKKFGSNYIVALFKYGVNFYVSDLNGVTYFRAIIN